MNLYRRHKRMCNNAITTSITLACTGHILVAVSSPVRRFPWTEVDPELCCLPGTDSALYIPPGILGWTGPHSPMDRSRSRDQSLGRSESRQAREKKEAKKKRQRSCSSSSSSSSSSSTSPSPKRKSRRPSSKKPDDKRDKTKAKRKRSSFSSSSSSSGSSSSSSAESSDSEAKRKRKAKRRLKKIKAREKKEKRKEKKKQKKMKKKMKKLKKRMEKAEKAAVPQTPALLLDKAPTALETWQSEASVELGPVMTDEQKARIATKRPMTKEEWDAKQSVIRRVVDPETGRTRLVRGEGEVLEEIVSKDRHKEINKQANIGDGLSFQKRLGMNR